jgi:hypothetical protein
MCKKSLLFVLLMAMFAPWAANAQTIVEIGDGTAGSNRVPIDTYYNYSISEQLYTADEIGTAGTITSISFNYINTVAKDFPIEVYMKNVDAADLSTAGISLADADLVFEGTLSVTNAGWYTIDLDTPFAYDGTSNLLIGVNKGYVYWFSNNSWQCTATEVTMARYSENDNNAYDTSTTPSTTSGNRPNIQMVITAGSGPVCDKPETFEVSNVTANSATLTWTGGSGTYNVEYKGGSVADWTAYLTNTTATTANLTGLTPGTAYQYRVQSVCGSDVSGWKSVNFSTMFGIPLVEGFGTAIPSGWSIYNGLVENVLAGDDLTTASYGWSFGSNNGVFDNHARVNIYGTSCNNWLVLPTLAMEDNVQLMFDVAYTAYSGTGAPAQTGDDDKFVVLVNNGRTWEIVRQWDNAGSEYVLNDLNTTPITVAIDLSNYAEAGQPITVAFYGESTVSNADNNLHIDNVSIDYIPACAKPTGLAVNYTGGTEATISWTSDATAWNMRVNGTEINGTITNPYILTGLELATTYEVEVQANCGDATSEWVGPVSFTTDNCMPEDQCALTFVVTDSYGDGWNGASIDIYDYTGETLGDLLASVANTNAAGAGEAQTYTLNFCNGQELAIIWTSGSYDSEASYTVTDINGDVVVEGSGNGFDGFAYTMDCTETDCRKPTDFVASEIGNHSVKLSWTENGPATSWNIEYISANDTESTTITVNTNPYILTGLTAETMYAAQVTPVCEVDKPSEVITWTTDVACPKPSDLNVTPYPFTADVTWNGFAEAYDIEWAQPVESTSSAWLQYDNGTLVSNVGSATAGTRTWGVMYPADMLEGNTLTKIAFYEVDNSYYTDGTVTLNVYSGGDTVPETLIGTQTFATEGTNGMREVVIDPIEINASQNLWITLTANATYCMAMSAQDGGANSRWFLNGSYWVDFSTVYTAGATYSYMIRGFVETTDYSAWNWSSESGITSPYTITGLEAETDYAVRVKAVCGGEDGESLWTWAYFTTPSACDAPVELEATDITYNAATLNWVGYQESYNLRYRHAEEADPTAPATIILEAHDVWGDESGYQMLLDADATAFGTIIPETGPLTTSGDASAETYAEFEYKIPTNADGSLTTENIVFDGSVTLEIPAGVYDWCIVNPSAGDRMWIAGEGDIPGRYDDYVFEPGVTYHFTMQLFGTGDGAALEIIRPMSNWTEVSVNEVPYTLTGLTPETYYEWQIQGVNASCDELEWSEIQNFTTLEMTTVSQTIELTTGWNWISTYIEMDPVELLEMLEEQLGENAIQIKSQTLATAWDEDEEEWSGRLQNTGLTSDKTYMIQMMTDATVTLVGPASTPEGYTITINPGWNWIGFPSAEPMDVNEALADFEAVDGDELKTRTLATAWDEDEEEWSGRLITLIPGQGFLFKSASDEVRYLNYNSGSSKKQAALQNNNSLNNSSLNRTKKVQVFELRLNNSLKNTNTIEGKINLKNTNLRSSNPLKSIINKK